MTENEYRAANIIYPGSVAVVFVVYLYTQEVFQLDRKSAGISFRE